MFPLTVTTIQDEKELDLTRDFLLKQPQFYPQYQEWVDGKCIPRIAAGEYKAIVVLSDKKVIGDGIYRFLDDRIVEIKNFRIDPLYRNRDLGHFLLAQIQTESKNAETVLDVTIDNFAGVEFFIRNGFKITSKSNLYLPDQTELLMRRSGLSKN